nr:hypothetical protein [Frankia sp. ArI3]
MSRSAGSVPVGQARHGALPMILPGAFPAGFPAGVVSVGLVLVLGNTADASRRFPGNRGRLAPGGDGPDPPALRRARRVDAPRGADRREAGPRAARRTRPARRVRRRGAGTAPRP